MRWILFAWILLSLAGAALAQGGGTSPAPLGPATSVRAADTPNDGGGSITVHWKAAPGAAR